MTIKEALNKGTFMLKNNIPVPTVSAVLGHASITTTLNTYAHLFPNKQEKLVSMLEDLGKIEIK